MRLLDLVAQSREPVRVALPGGGPLWELPGAERMAAEVAATPVRYILADNVREACHDIVARWPELTDPSSPALRLAVPAMWVEWDEPRADGPSGRTGILVKTGESGRSGTVHGFWHNPESGAEMAQAHVEFDLDYILSPREVERPELAGLAAFRLLAPHIRMVVEPEWMRFFASAARGPEQLRQAAARCSIQALPSFCLLVGLIRLTAMRANIDERPVDRSELNRARLRRGKPALLDHVEVSLAIGAAGGSRAAQAGVRAPARQHVVRGHLVNRSGTVFWRTAHLRGLPGAAKGPLKRNVRVSVAHGFRAQPGMWLGVEAAE